MLNKFLKMTAFVASCVFCGYGACSEIEREGVFEDSGWYNSIGNFELISKSSTEITARKIVCVDGRAYKIEELSAVRPFYNPAWFERHELMINEYWQTNIPLYMLEGKWPSIDQWDPWTMWRQQNFHSLCLPCNLTKLEGEPFYEDWDLPPSPPEDLAELGAIIEYNNKIKQVVFEPDSRITTIGKNTFYDCTNLQSICIPGSVKVIEENAFYCCFSLISIVFEPDSILESIGVRAFYKCNSLEAIKIPEQVNHIGAGAFFECRSLTFVEFLGDELQKNTLGNISVRDFYESQSLDARKSSKQIYYEGEKVFYEGKSLTFVKSFNYELQGFAASTFCDFFSLTDDELFAIIDESCDGIFVNSLMLNEWRLFNYLKGVNDSFSQSIFSGCERLRHITIAESDIRTIEEDVDYLKTFVKEVPLGCTATFERSGKTYVFSDEGWKEVV
jgi:hypothetical protein